MGLMFSVSSNYFKWTLYLLFLFFIYNVVQCACSCPDDVRARGCSGRKTLVVLIYSEGLDPGKIHLSLDSPTV